MRSVPPICADAEVRAYLAWTKTQHRPRKAFRCPLGEVGDRLRATGRG